MNKPFFVQDDFYFLDTYEERYKAAESANEKLEKYLDISITVYGTLEDAVFFVPDPKLGLKSGTSQKDTHKAKLVFIEELPKDPCKHEPEQFDISLTTEGYLAGTIRSFIRNTGHNILTGNKCRHCGVELQATWKEKI